MFSLSLFFYYICYSLIMIKKNLNLNTQMLQNNNLQFCNAHDATNRSNCRGLQTFILRGLTNTQCLQNKVFIYIIYVVVLGIIIMYTYMYRHTRMNTFTKTNTFVYTHICIILRYVYI